MGYLKVGIKKTFSGELLSQLNVCHDNSLEQELSLANQLVVTYNNKNSCMATKQNVYDKRIRLLRSEIMATLSVRFPNSIHDAVKTAAREDDISINQFVTSAVIEKLTALDTLKYLENRGMKGSREKYMNVLKKAPHSTPREDDVI